MDEGRSSSDPFGLQPILDRLGCKFADGNRRLSSCLNFSENGNVLGAVSSVDPALKNRNINLEEKLKRARI